MPKWPRPPSVIPSGVYRATLDYTQTFPPVDMVLLPFDPAPLSSIPPLAESTGSGHWEEYPPGSGAGIYLHSSHTRVVVPAGVTMGRIWGYVAIDDPDEWPDEFSMATTIEGLNSSLAVVMSHTVENTVFASFNNYVPGEDPWTVPAGGGYLDMRWSCTMPVSWNIGWLEFDWRF